MTIKFLASADSAVIVEFGSRADRAVSDQVLALGDRVRALGIAGVVEVVPTFRSLMVHYDSLRIGTRDLIAAIEKALVSTSVFERKRRLWRVPICYERDFAPDLEDIARSTTLATAEVVRLHAGTRYHVYMLGFVPGFPYMGDLVEALVLPRRVDPRIHVPPGSVSIATNQTAIYPLDSPGGWHLIGTTPIQLFDAQAERPALFAPGDAVEFEPIDAREFARIRAATERRDYRVESTELAA